MGSVVTEPPVLAKYSFKQIGLFYACLKKIRRKRTFESLGPSPCFIALTLHTPFMNVQLCSSKQDSAPTAVISQLFHHWVALVGQISHLTAGLCVFLAVLQFI